MRASDFAFSGGLLFFDLFSFSFFFFKFYCFFIFIFLLLLVRVLSPNGFDQAVAI